MCARALCTVLPCGSTTAFFGVMMILAFNDVCFFAAQSCALRRRKYRSVMTHERLPSATRRYSRVELCATFTWAVITFFGVMMILAFNDVCFFAAQSCILRAPKKPERD